jgi:DNA-binding transcriptional MocR family regulator
MTCCGQQALSLLACLLVGPGHRVLVEAPTYPGALEAFRESAPVLRPLTAGLEGFASAAREHRPVLAYVIASFHNPTGSVLPALERRRLARAAADAEVPLIDDEVLADLAFPGEEPPPPLGAYSSTVISVGSLSATITSAQNWPCTCPSGMSRRSGAGRPCGYVCRAGMAIPSRNRPCATA